MKLNSREIIRVLDFDFDNGQELKPRYFIVLDNDSANPLVLSIITSQDKVPAYLNKKGCIEEKESNVHCFKFIKEEVVGENGFFFPKNSYIYIQAKAVREIDEELLFEKYKDQIEHKDSLLEEEYGNLLYCISKSKYLKKKLKERFSGILETIYGSLD